MKINVKSYTQFINEDIIPSRLADNKKLGEFNKEDLSKCIGVAKYPEINEKIKHQGGRWLVFTKDGKKLLGSHDTRKEARAQLASIEISKHKG